MKTLRITNVNTDMIDEIKKISDHNIDTVCATLRPIIREISNYNNSNIDFLERGKHELKITNIPDDVYNRIEKLSKQIGITKTQYIKVKLFERINS